MSEMRDDLRRSVTRFCYPAFALLWAFVACTEGWNVVGLLFAALSARCIWRTIKVWRDKYECG